MFVGSDVMHLLCGLEDNGRSGWSVVCVRVLGLWVIRLNSTFLLLLFVQISRWQHRCHCWRMSWTLWSQQSGTWIFWSNGGRIWALIISSSYRMVTPQRWSRFLRVMTMSSTTGMTSIEFLAPKLHASPSRTVPADALVSWCPRRNTFSPLMMTAG